MDRMGREHDSIAHSMFLPHEIVASVYEYDPAFFKRFLLGEPGVPDAEQKTATLTFSCEVSVYRWMVTVTSGPIQPFCHSHLRAPPLHT